jgi:hypothetical protein
MTMMFRTNKIRKRKKMKNMISKNASSNE